MYLSLRQLTTSLQRLTEVHPFFGFAFFGFKKAKLPIGETKQLPYSFLKEEILEKYFKFDVDYDGYFNPFKSVTKWVSPRYDSTSLQRVIADTFGPAFLHKKRTSEWGWRPDYVQTLAGLMTRSGTAPIPALDVAVWFYRKVKFESEDVKSQLVDRLVEDFHLTAEELSKLFDGLVSGRTVDLDNQAATDVDVLNAVGWPEGSAERAGVALRSLELINVGPSQILKYQPTPRINVITGDNSLGKTFLLECAWWAMTGEWASYPAEPNSINRGAVEIRYTLTSRQGRSENFVAPFDRLEGAWQRPSSPFNGLALFSMFDGKVATWDPVRNEGSKNSQRTPAHVRFTKEQIWDGLTLDSGSARKVHFSNGLIRDCVTWRNSRRDLAIYEALKRCLRALSPPDSRSLEFGTPTKIQDDSREMPTIRMPYGDVPVVFASAGIQRVLGLAYLLVWTWFNHVENSERAGRQPLRQITILLDEIEAHLHPKWQRQILPSIIETLRTFTKDSDLQLHVASHSPLILASIEPSFDRKMDRIHQLNMNDGAVSLVSTDFVKHGSINAWLESEVFGLSDARSKPSETAIEDAKRLQLQKTPDPAAVEAMHKRLIKLLPDDDPFWVRWNFFYETSINRPK